MEEKKTVTIPFNEFKEYEKLNEEYNKLLSKIDDITRDVPTYMIMVNHSVGLYGRAFRPYIEHFSITNKDKITPELIEFIDANVKPYISDEKESQILELLKQQREYGELLYELSAIPKWLLYFFGVNSFRKGGRHNPIRN